MEKAYVILFLCMTSIVFGITSNAEFGGNISLTGEDFTEGTRKELRFYDGVNYVGFEAGALSGDQIWVLPLIDATVSGQALISDGAGTLSFGTPSTTQAHNILSATHDAATQGATRGSIIYGNATPKWDELVIGAAGTILRSDGTDVAWSATTNITTLGTIVTGIWNATAIDISDYTNLTVTAPITLTDDDVGFDDSAYSLIDGTRAFTGVVGGIFPTASAHLATKEYVDSAITFIAEYHFNNTASDIGGIYFKMLDTPTGEAESSFTTAGLGTGDDQALTNFATDSGFPGVTVLEAGIYSSHIHAEKTAGTKPVKIHFEIYSRALDTTETLITTSEESGFITSKTGLLVHATLTADATIATTDRLIIKWLANVDATGSAVTIVLYAEGTNASRVTIPITTDVLNQVFLRQDGTKALAGAWDMNNENITNIDIDSGDMSGVTISGGLTWSAAQDLNNQNLTNVDIDSGAIDGTTIGGGTPAAGSFTTLGASGTFTLSADPSVISSANEIQLKPSGDNDDYLEFSTVSGNPLIKRIGGREILYESDDGNVVSLRIQEDTSNYLRLDWDKSSNKSVIVSTGAIDIITNGDTTDHIQLTTVSDVPIIGTVGGCDLKITSDGGNIDFDDENLLFDTWKSADASKSIAWGSAATGSLVLDGTGDSVTVDGVIDTVNMTTGSFTGWVNLATGRVGDNSDLVIMALERTTDNDDRILIFRNTANNIRVQYREADTNKNADAAEPGTGWKFIAVTYNTSGNLILYIGDPGDGADATTDMSALNAGVPEVAAIGNRAGGIQQPWEGEISDITFWDDDLSQAEAEAVYDLGRNPTATEIEDGIANEAEILHWYPFTADADDHEVSWSSTADADGTFVGNAHVVSTAVAGLNTAYPILTSSSLTACGAGSIGGNLTVVGNERVGGNLIAVGDVTSGDDVFVGDDLDVSGNAQIDGTLTITGKTDHLGGSDPPYVLYNMESRASIVRRCRQEIPLSKAEGMAQFYNSDTNRIEYFQPSTGKFFVEAYEKITYESYLKEIYVWDDGKPCYNPNSYTRYYYDRITGTVKSTEKTIYDNKLRKVNRITGQWL